MSMCKTCDPRGVVVTIVTNCNTIVILLSEHFCLFEGGFKIMVRLFCMYGYQFCIETTENYQNIVKVH